MAATGFFLILFNIPSGSTGSSLTPAAAQQTPDAPVDVDSPQAVPPDSAADPVSAGESVEQATGTLREFGSSVYSLAPKLIIALAILLIAGLLAWSIKAALRRLLGSWSRADGISALISVAIWLIAVGAALSVIAGDTTALIGSVGLFGLALSWALQAPIESFTGWLLNSLRGYYRIGDRIEVGDAFGDVYRIDILTTTVWEAGGAEKAVTAAQPTGALITFPNSELLRSNIINYTRDFPFVWDEVTIGVTDDSDLAYTSDVFDRIACDVVGKAMTQPATFYRGLLQQQGLDYDVAVEPQIYFSPADSWTSVTIRYLVPARERRKWSSALVLALSTEAAKPEHRGKYTIASPRTQIEVVGGTPNVS